MIINYNSSIFFRPHHATS